MMGYVWIRLDMTTNANIFKTTIDKVIEQLIEQVTDELVTDKQIAG